MSNWSDWTHFENRLYSFGYKGGIDGPVVNTLNCVPCHFGEWVAREKWSATVTARTGGRGTWIIWQVCPDLASSRDVIYLFLSVEFLPCANSDNNYFHTSVLSLYILCGIISNVNWSLFVSTYNYNQTVTNKLNYWFIMLFFYLNLSLP